MVDGTIRSFRFPIVSPGGTRYCTTVGGQYAGGLFAGKWGVN